jgi:hypothetical protein
LTGLRALPGKLESAVQGGEGRDEASLDLNVYNAGFIPSGDRWPGLPRRALHKFHDKTPHQPYFASHKISSNCSHELKSPAAQGSRD